MTDYREILRLNSLGFSERNIAISCPCSRNTVSKVLKRANELNLAWPLPEELTNAVLEVLIYPKENSGTPKKRLPDLDYVHKELLKQGCRCQSPKLISY